MAEKFVQEFEDDHKPKMTDNTEDFQFAQFAKEKFHADESPYSSRDVLKHPLLQLKERKHQRMALKIWVVLLRLMVWLQEPRYLALMSEYKATHVDTLVTDPPMSDIQMIQYIIVCGTLTPDLRDEIYCQLCKQLTKNTDNQSKLKVWELLCLSVGCFPPSGNLVNYLRNFIKGGPSDYAPYCEDRLQTTIKKRSRMNPPGFLEIQATKTKKPLMLTVKFSDGMTIMITVDSATTARDLCPHIAEQISLVDQFGFMLGLHYCNQAYSLDSGDHVMDMISECELKAVSRGEEHDTASCYLVFTKKIFAPWQILSEDLVATNLIYFQVVNRVKSGYFRYDKDENLVRLTAKQNVNDPKVKEDIVSYVRNKLATSFSLFWDVNKVAGPGLQKDTACIAVNSTGLYVVDRQTDVNKWNGKYFIKLSFPEKLSILSNRTDDMPWFEVIVTIQTVKGDQYTFTADLPPAEEIKYIVEAIQTPPSKQDHSQAARRVPINWQKGQLLGKGAFGEVYRCYDKATGHEYAVKMVKPSILNTKITKKVQAMQNEIKLLSYFQHERIVKYFGCQNDGKVLSIFLEFMAGGSVKDLINELGELQESVVKKYARQVLLGLAYLHENFIVHQDIKAANILRDTQGNVKLCDFGSSNHLQTTHSVSGIAVGTPHWMAPEVIKEEQYNCKADIWSLGCTIVEMLSSKPPFHKYGPTAVVHAIVKYQPKYKLPPTVANLAEEFLVHTFQRTPADRWSAEMLLKHKFVQDGEAYGVVDDVSSPAGEIDVNKGAVAGVVDDISSPAGEIDVNKGAVAGVVDDISRPAGELDTNNGVVAGVVDDINRPIGELDVNKGAVAGVVDDINRPIGELDVNKGAVAAVVDDLNRPAGELDVNKGAVAGVVDDINRPAGELDVNEEGSIADVVDDISRPAGELDVNKEAVTGVVDDISRPAGELNVNKGVVAGVVDDISRPAGELNVNKGVVAGVVDDISRPAGELDTNKGVVAGVVDDINRPIGELDVNKGAVAGVVDDLNRPAGELDVNKGAVAGVVDDISRPPGELDINKGAVAGVVDDINRSAGELDVNKKRAIAGVVDDINRPAGELDANKGAVAGVVDDINRPAGELNVNKGVVAGVVDDISRPAGELDINEGAVAYVVDDISRPAGEVDVNKGTVAGVVDDINLQAGELDVNEGTVAIADVLDDISSTAGELDVNKGVVADVVYMGETHYTTVTGNVENVYTGPRQVVNSATDNLYNRTDDELDEELLYDVTDSKAFKSVRDVLDEDRIAFVVGSSRILRKTIALSCLSYYRKMGVKVLSLSSLSANETAAMMDEGKKFVFLDEVFGLITLNERRFDQVFDVLKKVPSNRLKRNNRLVFTLTPLAYHTCRNRLNILLLNFNEMVINLDDKDEFSEDTQFEILSNINRRVPENAKICLSKLFELSEKENPVFLECCTEFLRLRRYDINITQWFLQPMDVLIKEFMGLKDEWRKGYHVLVLVALCPEFGVSVKSVPKVMLNYMELIHHNYELGEINEICEQFIYSYLKQDFQFRYEMHRNAILGTIGNKEFLLANCPVSFINAMDAIFVKKKFYREENFQFYNDLSLLARRFVDESEVNFSKLTNLNVWQSEEFREIFD